MDPLAVLAYGAEQALPLTGTGTGSHIMKIENSDNIESQSNTDY